MQLFSGLLWRSRRLGRDQVAQRAARVLDKAMFDVGIDNFLNGTVMLDQHFRPRFFSATASRQRPGVATVVLSQLDEAQGLQSLACMFDLEAKREVPTDDTLFANPYGIQELGWSQDSEEYRFEFNERGHKNLRVWGR